MRLEDTQLWYCEKIDNGMKFFVYMDVITHLSVNHYKFQSGNTRPEIVLWKSQVTWAIRRLATVEIFDFTNCAITVRLDGLFSKINSKTIDIHNALKPVCDAVQDATGINDKFYATECGVPEIGEPKLIITVKAERK